MLLSWFATRRKSFPNLGKLGYTTLNGIAKDEKAATIRIGTKTLDLEGTDLLGGSGDGWTVVRQFLDEAIFEGRCVS